MKREDAFLELAQDVSGPLLRRATLITHDHQAAEDLVQETLTRLYVALPRLDDPRTAHAYAFTTMFRLAIDRTRRRSYGERPSATVPDSAEQGPEPGDRIDLSRALASLAPHERVVVLARHVDDRPVAEVAQMLGRSEAWVKTTSHRALAKLRVHPALAAPSTLIH